MATKLIELSILAINLHQVQSSFRTFAQISKIYGHINVSFQLHNGEKVSILKCSKNELCIQPLINYGILLKWLTFEQTVLVDNSAKSKVEVDWV